MYFGVETYIDALTLLLHNPSSRVRRAVSDLINIYEDENKENAVQQENDTVGFYVSLLQTVADDNLHIKNKDQMETLLLKFKTHQICSRDPDTYTNLKNILLNNNELSQERYEYLLSSIINDILICKNIEYVKQAFAVGRSVTSDKKKKKKIITRLNEIYNEAIDLNNAYTNAQDETNDTQARYVDFSDIESISKAFKVYTTTNKNNVFKTGWQGMNRAFGANRGWTLGESICFNALSHHGKTLSILNMIIWCATLNVPTDNFKNPTIVLFSLENETPQNCMLLFDMLYKQLFKAAPPPDMTDDEKIMLCHNEFTKNGWHLIIDRRIGAEFGFNEFKASMEELIRNGFTPLLCAIDYINMMKKGTIRDDGAGNHLLLRDLYTNICNYTKSRNCTLVTAHQLNRKAAEMARVNPVNVVSRFTIDVLADGMDPQREIDVSFYQYKETNQLGETYMTYKMDKHRYDQSTPERDKVFAYKFTPLGILNDIDGDDMSVRNIYATAVKKKGRDNNNDDLFNGEF